MHRRLLPLALLAVIFLAACDDPALTRTAALQGVISDASGAPITGASITLVREDATTATNTTTSGTDGAYSITNVPAGVFNLTATTSTLGAYRTGITLTKQQTSTADMTLTPLGNVIGTAVLEDNFSNSAGITIRLTGTTHSVTTPDNGNFTIQGVPAGTYQLTAATQGYATNTQNNITVHAGQGTVLPDMLELARQRPYARFTIDPYLARLTLDASNSTDSDGIITNYRWDLGDGNTLTGQQVTHTYASGGTKTITLTVTDNDGLTDTTSQNFTINVPARTATTDPATEVGEWGIVAGQTMHLQIDTPTNPNQLLYLEIDQDLTLEIHTGNEILYSVDNRGFSLTPRLPGPAAITPQAVSTSVSCRGSCVILPASGPNMMTIRNHTADFRVVKVYAYTEAPADENEPNNSLATATPLVDADTGAIETIGDQDYYRIETRGLITLLSTSDLQLRGRIYLANGTLDTRYSLSPGASALIYEGEYVMIEAIGDEAAASAASRYSLEITPSH